MRKSTINLIVLVKAMVLLVPINTDNLFELFFLSPSLGLQSTSATRSSLLFGGHRRRSNLIGPAQRADCHTCIVR